MAADLETANQLYRMGQFTQAESYFRAMPESNLSLMRLGEIALLNNRLSEAEQYLQQALERLNWFEKLTMSLQIKSLLAMSYYRQDKFPKAVQYFMDAAGFLPISPFTDLKALGTQLALFGDNAPYHIEGTQSTSLPFVITDPLPVVEASINNSEPMLFLLDTGGAELIIDTKTALSLGAEFVASLGGAGGGSKGKIALGKIDSLQLGDIRINNLPIHGLDTQHIATEFDNLPIRGIIGTRLLMHFLATIDYPNACLKLQAKGTRLQIQKAIPFYLAQSHYILAQGTLNDSDPSLFFIDTGLGGQGFALDKTTAPKFNYQLDGATAESAITGFGNTQTAAITAEKVTLGTDTNQVCVHQLDGIVFKKAFEVLDYRLGFFVGGVLSHSFFRNYALTLDFVGMHLLLDVPNQP